MHSNSHLPLTFSVNYAISYCYFKFGPCALELTQLCYWEILPSTAAYHTKHETFIWNYISINNVQTKIAYFKNFWDICPFEYTAVAVSRKVGIPYIGLTTPVGWLLLLRHTVLSQSLCNRSFCGDFVLSCCVLNFSLGVGGFCHRTESDLFLFLLRLNLIHLSFLFSLFRFHYSNECVSLFTNISGEKERNLTQSYDESPYTRDIQYCLSLPCQSKKYNTDLRRMYNISSNESTLWCAQSFSHFHLP